MSNVCYALGSIPVLFALTHFPLKAVPLSRYHYCHPYFIDEEKMYMFQRQKSTSLDAEPWVIDTRLYCVSSKSAA